MMFDFCVDEEVECLADEVIQREIFREAMMLRFSKVRPVS